MNLVGRSRELGLLTELLAQAAEGASAAVVVRGEPGIGKTALLDATAARAVAEGIKVARVTGVESEVPLGYAALHRLLLPFPGLTERLPAPQRDALQFTFGLVAGPPPGRFLIALAVLTLLADAASDAPLLCVIDDAQWLDPESAVVLGFVARRLQAEGIVMVFAARDLADVAPALQGLPEVVIGGLDAGDAAALLSSVATSRLNPDVQSCLVAEGGGNPLALAEVTDGGEQPDRVAWHLAMAATAPDEPVAARLAQVAGRAMDRGGYAATATFLARAAELSAYGQMRTDRLLAAAEAALTAGRPVQARALLDQAQSGAADDRHVGAALRLTGQVSFATGRPGDAARQLLAAAKRLIPTDARLGRRTLLDALIAANYTPGDALEEVRTFAMGVVAGTPVDLQDPSSTADCLLLGFLHRLSGAPKQAVPLLQAAVGHLRAAATPDNIRMSMQPVVGALAGRELLDEGASADVLSMYARLARRVGALMVLPTALTTLAGVLMFEGRFDDAQEASPRAARSARRRGPPGALT